MTSPIGKWCVIRDGDLHSSWFVVRKIVRETKQCWFYVRPRWEDEEPSRMSKQGYLFLSLWDNPEDATAAREAITNEMAALREKMREDQIALTKKHMTR